ncbi:MAG: T9SS type A sorting domain-containing protein [Calditrichaeota bacterium]|nr:T9SS type A sorting domain-containing protein [Calditrichota bacterium]
MSGRKIRTLFDGYRQAGFHSVRLNADDLTSGLYFMRLEGSGFMTTRKVILIR